MLSSRKLPSERASPPRLGALASGLLTQIMAPRPGSNVQGRKRRFRFRSPRSARLLGPRRRPRGFVRLLGLLYFRVLDLRVLHLRGLDPGFFLGSLAADRQQHFALALDALLRLLALGRGAGPGGRGSGP